MLTPAGGTSPKPSFTRLPVRLPATARRGLPLRLEPGPGVLEAECAVEDELPRRRVRVRAEVAEALELHGLTNRQLRKRRLDQALPEHRLRVGVDVSEGVAVSAGIEAA